jgi:fumarate reductase flavoprotein subunit
MVWDVLVCGAGTAGMPAALFASERGAKVLVIEHAPVPGGTLHVAAGQISAAGTRIQREKGIVDSADRHFDDIVRITEGKTTKAFARLAADHSADTLHWLLDLGWRPMPEHPVLFGKTPYSVPRTYWGTNAGVDILRAIRPRFMAAVNAGRIELRLETELVDLLEEAGAVCGAVVRDRLARIENIRAANTLIATGGFGSGPARFAEYTGYACYGWAWPFNRGMGTELVLKAGGVLKHREHFIPRFAGVIDPRDPGRVERVTETAPARRPPWEIYVARDGKRFCAEDDDVGQRREQMLGKLPDLTFWVIYDEEIRKSAPPFFDGLTEEQVEARLNDHPSYVRAPSLDALATATGLPLPALQATIGEYNQAVANGRDRLGRTHLPKPIATPPFYAILHHGAGATTIPGVAVNTEMQAVRSDGSVIAGLYAAGEILGMGLHSGGAFVGGLGLMPALTYGRLLGQRWLRWDKVRAAAE